MNSHHSHSDAPITSKVSEENKRCPLAARITNPTSFRGSSAATGTFDGLGATLNVVSSGLHRRSGLGRSLARARLSLASPLAAHRAPPGDALERLRLPGWKSGVNPRRSGTLGAPGARKGATPPSDVGLIARNTEHGIPHLSN